MHENFRRPRSRVLFGLHFFWVRLWPLVLGFACCLALFVGSGLVAGALAGCNQGVPADTYGPTAAAVARANAAPGAVGFVGVADAAPAAVAGAVENASWLNVAGAVALLVGCGCLGHPAGPNGLGGGLALGGAALLVAGFVLPLYAGWCALGLVLAAGALLVPRLGLGARLKSAVASLNLSHSAS